MPTQAKMVATHSSIFPSLLMTYKLVNPEAERKKFRPRRYLNPSGHPVQSKLQKRKCYFLTDSKLIYLKSVTLLVDKFYTSIGTERPSQVNEKDYV